MVFNFHELEEAIENGASGLELVVGTHTGRFNVVHLYHLTKHRTGRGSDVMASRRLLAAGLTRIEPGRSMPRRKETIPRIDYREILKSPMPRTLMELIDNPSYFDLMEHAPPDTAATIPIDILADALRAGLRLNAYVIGMILDANDVARIRIIEQVAPFSLALHIVSRDKYAHKIREFGRPLFDHMRYAWLRASFNARIELEALGIFPTEFPTDEPLTWDFLIYEKIYYQIQLTEVRRLARRGVDVAELIYAHNVSSKHPGYVSSEKTEQFPPADKL